MASDLGDVPIVVEWVRGGTLGANWVAQGVQNPTRAIWYARYIDWTITTPLLLLELLLVTGLPLSQIFSVLFFDILMIETGLIGALVRTRYKYVSARLLDTYTLLTTSLAGGASTRSAAPPSSTSRTFFVPGRRSSQRLGSDFHKSYSTGALYLCLIWIVYPVIVSSHGLYDALPPR